MKRQDVSSTRNALRIAQQAEETGRATLERLGEQGERIHNAERNLDLTASQNRLAEDKAREIKHLNRSMWAMKVDNPFTKSKRIREQDEAAININRSERERRDATRSAAFASQTRQQEAAKDLRGTAAGLEKRKQNLAERSKYQFEADSEDEAMEDELDNNLELMSGAVGRLNKLGTVMGQEVDAQNKQIDKTTGKACLFLLLISLIFWLTAIQTDRVDDQIAVNRARLDRIGRS